MRRPRPAILLVLTGTGTAMFWFLLGDGSDSQILLVLFVIGLYMLAQGYVR